jgi:hypothetical protein
MENTTQKPKSGGWKVMGIISVILGGLSILFAFIPCLGMYAMYTGIVATIMSIIALVMANSAKAPKMLAIIALVLSVASIGVGYWRYKQIEGALGSIQQSLNSLSDSLKNTK